MAQPLNHSGAFATVTPIKKDMAGLVGDMEDNAFKYRAEQRIKDDIAQKQKEKEDEKAEKLRDRILKTPTLNSTGVQSLDELNGRVLRQAIDRKYEIYKKLSDGGLSTEERVALEVENKNIDNLPENLKLGNDNIQKWFADYDKKVADGSIWNEDNIDKKRKNGFDAFVPTLDERGLPLIGFRDLDGDGKIDPIPWENIKDGTVLGGLMPKMDYNKTVDNAAKVLGTKETVDVNGYKTTTTELVPLNNIETYADSMMFENGEVSPFTLSRARELGLGFNNKELTPEEIQRIRQDLIKDISIRTKVVDKEAYDYNAQNAAAKLREEKRQFNLKRKDEKPIEPSSKDFNNYSTITKESTDPNDPLYGIKKGSKGYSFEGYNLTRSLADGTKEKVKTIFKTPEGHIVMTGVRTIGTEEGLDENGAKTKGTKTVNFSYSSENKAGDVADFISKVKNEETGEYFKSVEEFKDLARRKEKGPKTKKTISGF